MQLISFIIKITSETLKKHRVNPVWSFITGSTGLRTSGRGRLIEVPV